LPVAIDAILSRSAERVPDRVALIEGERCLTYAEADSAVNRVANALLGLRLAPGAKIALMSTSRLEYPLVYFGVARAGLISVHLPTRATVDDVAFMLNKVRADVLIYDAKYAASVTAAAAHAPTLRHLIALNGKVPTPPEGPGYISLNDFIADASDDAPGISVDGNAPLAITFTGGTTGFPKGVVASHNARMATATSAAAEFGLTDDDIVITSTPLFHAAGLYVWFSAAIMLGTTVVLQRVWDPVDFMNQVQRHAVTAGFLVPSQISDLISHPDFSADRLKSLNKLGYAGAPMSSALFARIHDAFPAVEFTENYGQSETCPITVRCPRHPEEKLNTVGKMARDVEVRIVDSDGNALPPNRTGDIVVRAEHNFVEYFDDPEQTANAFRYGDNWLWTGDLGYLDEDGFLTLVDRSKDMLVSGGENIYPAEIENALYQHDAVAECAVFGIPDDRLGEVPAACIVLRSGISLSEGDLSVFLTDKIARHKHPRLIKFLDSIPHTPVGKIRKNLLRDPYWQGYDKKI